MFQAIIKAKSKAELRRLGQLGIDFKDHSAIQDKTDFMFRVNAIISEDTKKRLENLGYIVEIVTDYAKKAEETLRDVSRTNRFRNMRATLDGQDVAPDKNEQDVAHDKYMNVEEIEDELIYLSKKYSDLVELIPLPNKTWEGRTSHAVLVHSEKAL